AAERERYFVVVVIHRCGAAVADVERLVEGQGQGNGMLQLLRRHDLAVDLQRSRSAPTYAAQIVVCERLPTEPVVLEVVHNCMLPGSQFIASLPTGPLEVEKVIREHRLTFEKVQRIADESISLADDHALGTSLRDIDVRGDGVGGVEQARLVAVR